MSPTWRAVLISALWFCGERSAAAADLTLDQVLSSVESAYPIVRVALAEQAEARAGLRVAEGGFDPSVRASATLEATGAYPKVSGLATVEVPTALWGTSLFGGYRIGRGTYASYDGKLETNDYGEVRGGLRLPLLRDGSIDRRRAGLRSAELGVDAGRLSAEQQVIEARRAASLRYWDWVAAGARLDVVRSWLDLARSRDEALATRVARGDLPEFERSENARTIYQRETALAAAERDAQQAAIELSLFVRDDARNPRVPGPAERPSLPEPRPLDLNQSAAETAAVARRPEIRRLEIAERRGRIDRDLASNQRLPALDVIASGAQDLGPGDAKRGLPVVEVTALMEVPLFNRVAGGRYDASQATLQKTGEQLRLSRDRAVADVRNAMASHTAARTRAVATAKELSMAQTLATGELRRFELGESTLLLVNLREQASAEAGLRHIDVVADVHRAVATLRAALSRNGTSDPHDGL